MSFDLGRIVATPGALELLGVHKTTLASLLNRHTQGDWGDLDDEDVQTNNDALKLGNRILSQYKFPLGEKVWVITEADRSATTLLLPEEY